MGSINRDTVSGVFQYTGVSGKKYFLEDNLII